MPDVKYIEVAGQALPAPALPDLRFFETDPPVPIVPDVERRSFVAVHNIYAEIGKAASGEPIFLSRDEYDQLKGSGSIQGDWDSASQMT
jgi:hypothetical protein